MFARATRLSTGIYLLCRLILILNVIQLGTTTLADDQEAITTEAVIDFDDEPTQALSFRGLWPSSRARKSNHKADNDLSQDAGKHQRWHHPKFERHARIHHGRDEHAGESDKLSPIIMVPGYGGSRLEGKRSKPNTRHYICERESDWTNIWLDIKLMLPYMIDCLIEDFRLEFDANTNETHNTDGMDIRVRDPDELANVEYLTDIHLPSLGYFAPVIRRLVTNLGYKRNLNIRGAPYDFRKAPNELADYFAKLRADSEQLFQQQGQRVTYICHSMGCNNILYLLQNQSPEWKSKHVERVISLAAPWAGSMQAVRAAVFGDNLGLPYLFDEAQLNIVQKSVPSTMYLFPKVRAFQDAPLITFNTSYTAHAGHPATIRADDFKLLFDKMNHPEGYLMWLNTKDLLGSLEAPQVELWSLYGRGRPTLGRLEFQGDIPDKRETDIYDDGDGTVSVQSSTFCRQWASEQTQPIHTKAFHTGHVDILKDPEVLDTIERILSQNGK